MKQENQPILEKEILEPIDTRSLEKEIESIENIQDEIETSTDDSLADEDEILKKLKSLDANNIEISDIMARVRGIDEEILKTKSTTTEKVFGLLNSFYAENFKDIGKSVLAEFKMRPIYEKYIKLDKDDWKIYKKGEKLKKKNPNADLTHLDPYNIRHIQYGMGYDIFDAAEGYKKIPEFVKDNKYNETNINDLNTYQKYLQYRRFKNFPGEDFRGFLHREEESKILTRLYAIQLNQIRDKLKNNNHDISENLDAYFQPAVTEYHNSEHSSVYSKENGSAQNTRHNKSIVSRIESFLKAVSADNITFSDEDRILLKGKVIDIFSQSSDDLARNSESLKSIRSFLDLCKFSEDHEKAINSILFNLMLKNKNRHWFSRSFDREEFPYSPEQINNMFLIVEQSDIQADGIRVPHFDKYYSRTTDSFDVIGTDRLAKFPFTDEQREVLGGKIVSAMLETFTPKIEDGDFEYFLNFEENNKNLEKNKFISSEKLNELTIKAKEAFVNASRVYIDRYLTLKEGDDSKITFKQYDFQVTRTKEEFIGLKFDFGKVLQLKKVFESSPENDKYTELLGKIPWKDSIDKMLNIQKRPRRKEYDPWITDLTPLVQSSILNGTLSIKNPEDGEVLLEFIKRVGPVNLPRYFSLFKKILSSGSVENMDNSIKDQLKSVFNIDVDKVCKNDPKNLNLIFAETEKFRVEVNKYLINEDPRMLDVYFASDYGKEFFSIAAGNSGFDSFGYNTIEKYKKNYIKNPELFQLPVGYIPASFEISAYQSDKPEDEIKNEEEINKLLQNKDLLIFHSNIYDAVSSIKEKNKIDRLKDFNLAIIDSYRNELLEIGKKIIELNSQESINTKALSGLDIKKQQIINSQSKFLKSADQILSDSLEGAMETYNTLVPDSFSEKQQVLLELSLEDIGTRFPVQFEKLKNSSLVKSVPTPDSISIFSEFIRNYMGDHYLSKKHGENDAIKTKDKSLIKYLQKIWGTQDFDTKIISVIDKKIAMLERGELSNEKRPIDIIPSKGIQRIVSGHLGSACTSSRAGELAEGKYPGIVSYSLVMYKDTPKQKFVGSFLVIETKTSDKKPILVIRANNPAQNLFNVIDTQELNDKIFEEVKNVAKRKNIELVGVALGGGTASNRTFVSEYHDKAVKSSVSLVNDSETNFNGHAIYNSTGLI